MAEIKTLLEKLKAEAEEEEKMFSGEKERQFFIEIFPAGSVDELLEEYVPDKHNSDWDSERQKPAPDPQKIIQSRQAIAFMNSGRNGVFRRYKETELTTHVHGKSFMIRNQYFIGLTRKLTDEGMKMYEKG